MRCLPALGTYDLIACAPDAGPVTVIGFDFVDVGVLGSTRWPLRQEIWCVIDNGEMLVHPDRLNQGAVQ